MKETDILDTIMICKTLFVSNQVFQNCVYCIIITLFVILFTLYAMVMYNMRFRKGVLYVDRDDGEYWEDDENDFDSKFVQKRHEKNRGDDHAVIDDVNAIKKDSMLLLDAYHYELNKKRRLCMYECGYRFQLGDTFVSGFISDPKSVVLKEDENGVTYIYAVNSDGSSVRANIGKLTKKDRMEIEKIFKIGDYSNRIYTKEVVHKKNNKKRNAKRMA